MSLEDNKDVINRFLRRGLEQRDLTVVDEVFASDHILRSPLTGVEGVSGTEEIKRALEDYHNHAQGTGRFTIENQIAEGDWVATSYTLRDAQEEHMGVMFSRLDDSKIQETFVVARDVSGPESDEQRRRHIN
jgi:ketosteroid isomerase-like protein